MPTVIHSVLLTITIVLYLLGRLCDDLAWYNWDGLSSSGFEGIALGTLATSAIITISRRSYEEEGLKTLFVESQMRFLIPWSIVILVVILLFNIFGCQHDVESVTNSNLSIMMDYTGCCLYSVVIVLTNLNYSVLCNPKGDLPLLFFYLLVLFAEIIYNGTLILKFIDNLEEKPKDFSILFVSITIAWEVLVMDLMFRGAYEEKEKELKHKQLQILIASHEDIMEMSKGSPSGKDLREEGVEKMEKATPHQPVTFELKIAEPSAPQQYP